MVIHIKQWVTGINAIMWDSLSVISTLASHKDSVIAHLVITPYVIVIYDILCHASLDAALSMLRFIAKKLRLSCFPVLSVRLSVAYRGRSHPAVIEYQ